MVWHRTTTPARLVIPECLANILPAVAHEGPVLHHGLADVTALEHQDLHGVDRLEVDVLNGIQLQAPLALDLSTAHTAPPARVDVGVAAHLTLNGA